MDLDEEKYIQPLLTIGRALIFKTKTKDDTICNFMSKPTYDTERDYHILESTLREQEQEELTKESLVSSNEVIPVIDNSKIVPI